MNSWESYLKSSQTSYAPPCGPGMQPDDVDFCSPSPILVVWKAWVEYSAANSFKWVLRLNEPFFLLESSLACYTAWSIHQPKSICEIVPGPRHICRKGLTCLPSAGEDVPNLIVNWCPRVGVWRWRASEVKGTEVEGRTLWGGPGGWETFGKLMKELI